jgi:hypothetical protein
MNDPDLLKARLLAQVATVPSATRPEARRRAAASLLLSLAAALAVFAGAGGLAPGEGRPRGVTLVIAGGWGLFCAGLSALVLRRGGSTLGRRPAVLLLAALAAPVALAVWLHAFHGAYVEPFARVGWRCLGGTLLMASPPLASLLVLRRGAEPRHPGALGAGIGAVCGAWAAALVDLWCPLTNLPHVLLGHVLPLGLLVALGTLAGRSVLGVRGP